ncbi:MAG: DUF2809 domain-containing protein [Desulfobacterales bacterium]|nr:DUF2809 domain-containing protein [Desulfobacterales bacterium]
MSEYLLRLYIVPSLLLVASLGLLFKFYSGPAGWWFNNYGAGVVYEVFWILVGFFLFPGKKAANRIPFSVFGITCGLEILQLSHPWPLEKIRSYPLGSALIGTTFTWWDFPHYAIGCVIGWLIFRKLAKTALQS